MYIIMISYSHILWNDVTISHVSVISTHSYSLCVMMTFKICLLSNVQACNPGLLTIVTSLYIVFLGINFFLNWTFVPFEDFYSFSSLSNLTSSNHKSVLCICEYVVSICFLSDFTCKWDRMVPPFPVTYSTKHIPSKFTSVAENSKISFPFMAE